jgi:hypothetical protein
MSNSAIPPRLLTCNCLHCNEKIEFDAGGVKGDEIVTLECPHCKAETTATIPPTDAEIQQAKVELEKVKAEQLIIQKVIQIKDSLRTRMQNGKPLFLYESVFVPVDSELLDNEFASEFDVSILRKLGLLGWDVVLAVPKTKGIGLENIGTDTLFGSKWAGGVGGNVMGVHIIIKKTVSASDLTNEPDDEVGNFIRSHLEDFLPE